MTPDLAGAWVAEVVVATTARAPVVGETRSRSVSLVGLSLAPEGDGWRVTQRLCRSRVESGSPLVRTELPADLLRAVSDRTWLLEVEAADGGWRFRADPGAEDLGWSGQGAFPGTPIDEDRDGNPGVSVSVDVLGVGMGHVWVAQHAHLRFSGVVGTDRLDGQVELVALQQEILGARPAFLGTPLAVRPDPARSSFSMWRGSCG